MVRDSETARGEPTRGTDPDAELVRRTLDGHLVAFEQLVDRHRDVVVRVAVRVVGRDAGEDVAQDTFLRAFNTLHSFRGEAPFRAWLLRIAHNTALNALARRRPVLVLDPLEPDAQQAGTGRERTPADDLELRERRERLEEKVRMLRPAHRAVVVLRDFEGLSYDEIAAVTGSSLASVKGRLFRGRRELIEILRNNSYDWELPE